MRDQGTAAAALPLVQPSDLAYQGSFRLPNGPTDDNTFAYAVGALAYDTTNDSLFMVGHAWYNRVAEVSIPKLISATSVDGLAKAALRQPFTDVLGGRRTAVAQNSSETVNIGGLLPYRGNLIVSAYVFYDANGLQTLSHFVAGRDFSALPPAQGPYAVSSPGLGFRTEAGLVSGYMAPIPSEWQADLGAPYMTGQCCLSIISRTSEGPSVTAFDPSRLGVDQKVSGTTLLGYPLAHETLGVGRTTQMGGMAFPTSTRTVLFIGRTGTTPDCYGVGTSDNPPGVDEYGNARCYDPTAYAKGYHGYPYASMVWAYDVLDLIAVKKGTKAPWEVKPYATWPLKLPFANAGGQIVGVAYDPATRRLFVAGGFSDGPAPLIHVFTVTATGTGNGLCRY